MLSAKHSYQLRKRTKGVLGAGTSSFLLLLLLFLLLHFTLNILQLTLLNVELLLLSVIKLLLIGERHYKIPFLHMIPILAYLSESIRMMRLFDLLLQFMGSDVPCTVTVTIVRCSRVVNTEFRRMRISLSLLCPLLADCFISFRRLRHVTKLDLLCNRRGHAVLIRYLRLRHHLLLLNVRSM